MPLFKPNATTQVAVNHPVRNSVFSGLVGACLGAAGGLASGALSAVLGAAIGFVLLFGADYCCGVMGPGCELVRAEKKPNPA